MLEQADFLHQNSKISFGNIMENLAYRRCLVVHVERGNGEEVLVKRVEPSIVRVVRYFDD